MDIEKLEKLNELKEKGILTQKEFDEKKKELLETDTATKTTSSEDESLWTYFKVGITQKYACFTGRARRREYFGFYLYSVLIPVVVSFFFGFLGGATGNNTFFQMSDVLTGIINIFLLIPSISVLARRLHDVNMSGWWILTMFVPLVTIFFKSDMQKNKYGSIPEGVE